MKPIYSAEDRNRLVERFIAARYQGTAKIKKFDAVVPYLLEKRVKILRELECSGYTTNKYGEVAKKYYVTYDAEAYFDWLTSVVTGAEPASEDTLRQANDQLFIFILALRQYTDIDGRVKLVEPYDWERKVTDVLNLTSALNRTIEQMDKDVVETLVSILKWMKKYNPILDRMDKEYQHITGGKQKSE